MSVSDKHVIRLHESLPLPADPRVWAEIDRAALADNWRDLCDHIIRVSPDTFAMAVVKADAYGHGIYPAVHTLLHAGCRAFALACAEEAAAAREIIRDEALSDHEVAADDVELLVLGHTPTTDVRLLASHRITTTVLSETYAAQLSAAAMRDGLTVACHIALDTGMHRIGLPACSTEEIADTAGAVARICEMPGLRITGVFSHLSCADEDQAAVLAPGSHTMTQYHRFMQARDAILAALPRTRAPMIWHLCNSAAAVRFPDALPDGCLDAVRLGISLYGYGTETVDGRPLADRPVMKLKTRVVHLHTLAPGERLGYGGDYAADTPRRIATLPVGYADGFLRAFRGAMVTVYTTAGGKITPVQAPIVGRICMDQCMLDVTGLDVSVGDEVTLFGNTPEELTSLAHRAGTIPYELLCLITARVPRVVV